MMTFKTDKVTHGYLPTYQRIANELGPAANICEIGVANGWSLEMWQTLYPQGTIVGVDRLGSTWPPGTHEILSDQCAADLPEKLAAITDTYNLIVDDASHAGSFTRITFDLLWPLVAPGGYYIIEDWQISLWGVDDDAMLNTVASLLHFLDNESDVEAITYRYGMCIVKKR